MRQVIAHVLLLLSLILRELEILDGLEHKVPALIILNESLDNVLVLHLDIYGLVQHPFHVVNLVLLSLGKVYCLYSAIPHLLKFCFLFQYVVAVFLTLLLDMPELLGDLKVALRELLVVSLPLGDFLPQLSVLHS